MYMISSDYLCRLTKLAVATLVHIV